ncbi:MAG: hypothetical protein U5K51_09935 [Flavobacteriaceae bacterium]|nr:hypothetical protein [Flavobacteriaceae bacterium]
MSRLCFPQRPGYSLVEGHTASDFFSNKSRILNTDSLYKKTLDNHPSIKAARLKITLEEKQKEIAQAAKPAGIILTTE